MKIDIYETKDVKDCTRINFIYQGKENLSKYSIDFKNNLKSEISNNLDIQRKLVDNYCDNLDISNFICGDRCSLSMEIKNYTKEYTMNNEDTTLNAAKILFNIATNINNFIYTDKDIKFAREFFANSIVYIQIISKEETANNILNEINFEFLEKTERKLYNFHFEKIGCFENNYRDAIKYLFQHKDLEFSEESIIKNELLSIILNKLFIDKLRSEKSISYATITDYEIENNAIKCICDFEEKNRRNVMDYIEEILCNLKNGNLNRDIFEYSKEILNRKYENKNENIYKKLSLDLKKEVLGYKFDLQVLQKISLEDIIEYFKNFEIFGGK